MHWYLAALFGALAIILAFPTIGWSIFALVAWIPLLALARESTWRRRLLFGWLMGFVYQAVLFRWIVFTAREMSGLPTVAGIGILVAFALWHGLMCGVFLALAEPARRVASARHPALGPLAIAAIYGTVEWVWPILFPWGLGHAFWEQGLVTPLLAWTGVPGLSFGVMVVSAAAALFLRERSARLLAPSAVALAVLLTLAVGWSWHLESTPPRRVLKVGAIQMNYTLEEKKGATIPRRRQLFERFQKTLTSIKPGQFDLLVASEGAYPLFWDIDVASRAGQPAQMLSTRATRALQGTLAQGPKTDAIIGGLRRPPGDRLRNSAVHLAPDGVLTGSYDKRILIPFGETMPLSDLFPALKTAVKGVGDFARGETPCRFEAAGEAIACGICYETIFPGFTRDTAAGDASLLVNLTIDVWFGRSTAPWFHLMVHASRAAELGVPLVRSALTGISAVVGPDGVPVALMPLDDTGILEAEVPLRDVTTPYGLVGPVFPWLLSLTSAALLARARWRSSDEAPSGDGDSTTTAVGGVANT